MHQRLRARKFIATLSHSQVGFWLYFPAPYVYIIISYPPIIEEGSQRTFLAYAKNHFQVQVQKKHLSKKQISVEHLIVFSKKLLAPLHTYDSKETQRAAIDLFDKIITFSGDGKKEKALANPDILFQTILDLLVKRPELVDEAYAQIIKQMTNNPRAFVLCPNVCYYN